jgi:hypothetical protein
MGGLILTTGRKITNRFTIPFVPLKNVVDVEKTMDLVCINPMNF